MIEEKIKTKIRQLIARGRTLGTGNYGDTPSNPDLRCGLEGVGTIMRRGRPSGATPLDRSSGQGAAAPLRFAPGQCRGIA